MDDVEDFLEHYGVKGMKWGVRRRPKPKSTEAKNKEKILAKAKSKGKDSLSNKEIADLNKRLQLETQMTKLMNPPKKSKVDAGLSFAGKILAVGATANAAISFAKSPAGQFLAKKLGKTVITGAP